MSGCRSESQSRRAPEHCKEVGAHLDDELSAPSLDAHEGEQIEVDYLTERVFLKDGRTMSEHSREQVGEEHDGHMEVNGCKGFVVELRHAKPLLGGAVKHFNAPA